MWTFDDMMHVVRYPRQQMLCDLQRGSYLPEYLSEGRR